MSTARSLPAQHRQVMMASTDVIARIRVEDLGRPTPCSAWHLRQLVAHMAGQNHGFAVADDGLDSTADPDDVAAAWEDREVEGAPARVYDDSVDRVAEAFAVPDLESRAVWLPAIAGGITVPATMAMGFHLLDYVVHTWDVARSLDRPDPKFDADVLDSALLTASLIQDGPERNAPDALFGPVGTSDRVDPLSRLLVLTGRDPDWQMVSP
jgi:uncharacterized protein (TIGR03086 family)